GRSGCCCVALLLLWAGAGETPGRAGEPAVGDVEMIESPGFRDGIERHWLRITGRTVDADGEPVAGATIYVTNANRSRPGNLDPVYGTITSDAEGRFVMEPVGVLVYEEVGASPLPQPRQTWFDLFAVSPEHRSE